MYFSLHSAHSRRILGVPRSETFKLIAVNLKIPPSSASVYPNPRIHGVAMLAQVPTKSNEQGSKASRDVIDKLGHFFERWDKRLTLENPNFIERYKEGELQILFQFSTGIVPKEYVIIFQGKPHVGNSQYPRVRFRRLWEQLRIKAWQMDAEVCSNDGDRETVFVDNTQPVQTPENLSLPSLIWLDRADSIYAVLPHSLYLSKASGFVFRGAVSDWEINSAFASRISSAPESASQVIEGSSQILNSVASDGGDYRVDWLDVRDTIRGSSLRINVAYGFIWSSFEESVDFNIQIRDVMVGPFDFDPD
jgi:hypothetical protein